MMNRHRFARRLALGASLLLVVALPAAAGSTQTWVRSGDTLRTGTAEGMVVTPDGVLAVGPRAEIIGRPETGVLWQVIVAGGDIIAGGSEGSGLWRARTGGTPVAAPAPGGPEVFALARGAKDELFVATGPDGAVYEIDLKTNRAREILKPSATYIWALAPAPDGGLLVATGLPGKVIKVDRNGGEPREIWSAADDHVRSLLVQPDGRILAGASPSGQLVELDGRGGGFVLWDSDRAETVAIAVDARGTIWAAFAGSVAKPEARPTGAPRATADGGSVAVTVRARPTEEQQSQQQEKKPEEPTQPARVTELPGGGGALVRLGVGEEPEVVWSDEKQTPLTLAPWGEAGVLLGAANPANIWWFDGAGRLGLFDERKENRAVSALLRDGERLVAALSNPAALVVYGPGAASPARWTSDVQDMKVRSAIGRVQAFAAAGDAETVKVLVRAGNTATPGSGWTAWMETPGAAGPPDRDGGRADALPRARFFQVRVEKTAGEPYALAATRVAVRYRSVNRPPRIENIEALPQGVALRSLPPSQMSSGEVPVISPPRGPDMEKALGEATPQWRSKKAYEPSALTITWDAKDPDGDSLRYRIERCRDEGGVCTDWTLMADDLDQSFFSFDSRTLPDGVYVFRITATDGKDNAAGEQKTASRVSDPVTVDNVSPVIERAEWTQRADGKVELLVRARDAGGRLVKAEIAGAADAFVLLSPADGVADGAAEEWTGVIPAPAHGDEVLVRVVDAAGNSATRRATKK